MLSCAQLFWLRRCNGFASDAVAAAQHEAIAGGAASAGDVQGHALGVFGALGAGLNDLLGLWMQRWQMATSSSCGTVGVG